MYSNISHSTDNFKVSNKEQEILYNNERNKIKDKYKLVLYKLKSRRDYEIAIIEYKSNKASRFNRVFYTNRNYLELSIKLRADYIKELGILREVYNYNKINA